MGRVERGDPLDGSDDRRDPVLGDFAMGFVVSTRTILREAYLGYLHLLNHDKCITKSIGTRRDCRCVDSQDTSHFGYQRSQHNFIEVNDSLSKLHINCSRTCAEDSVRRTSGFIACYRRRKLAGFFSTLLSREKNYTGPGSPSSND